MLTPGMGPADRWDHLVPRDARHVHLITRGNVDGIVSSAIFFSKFPDARVSYVPSATAAVEVLRKDLSARVFYVIDIGLTPQLTRTLNLKAKTGQRVVLIDHHQQSAMHAHELGAHVEVVVEEAGSAASVALRHMSSPGAHLDADLEHLERLAAVADLVEYGVSPYYFESLSRYGADRLEEEAVHLDFSWRLEVEDDRFRAMTGRRLARGAWPSEVPEVRRRYLTMVNENRWLKAKDRVRSRLVIRNGVGLLNFGKRKPSLLGFGTRALTSVAKEEGASVAVLVNRRRDMASLALRRVGESELNLGLFVERFTAVHGVVGGGHPASAGAKILARDFPLFMQEVYALA